MLGTVAVLTDLKHLHNQGQKKISFYLETSYSLSNNLFIYKLTLKYYGKSTKLYY